MRRFVRWRDDGENSVNDRGCFDIGITTSAALDRWLRSEDPYAGATDPRSAGNGSLMRLAPVPIRFWNDRDRLRDVAGRQSRTTHAAPEAVDACAMYADIVADAIEGRERNDVLRPRTGPYAGNIQEIASGSWRAKTRSQIHSSGYVAHSLEAALWCVGSTADFESAILKAANLGDDIALGQNALYTNTANSNAAFYNTAIGTNALYNDTTGGENTALGFDALFKNTTGSDNVALGPDALFSNSSGGSNTAIGEWTLYNNTTGGDNTASGRFALFSNTTGRWNAADGYYSLYANTTGSNNVAAGLEALQANTTGSNNVADGFETLYYNTAATSSVAEGYQAGLGTAAYSNQGDTAVGYQSGYSFQTGSDFNTLLGYRSGDNVTTGSNNILIGSATSSAAIANLTTGSQNILIGNNISLPSATANGQLDVGNIIYGTGITGTGSTLSSGNLGIGTTTPWRKLSATGTVGFDGLTNGFGAGSLCLTANKEVVYNAGSDNCLSSLRLTKHDINPLAGSATSTIVALSPVSFIYNDDASSTVRYGFIAENTAAVDQHLATYDQNGALTGVDDRAILSVIVRALQGLIATISGFAQNFATQTLVADNATFKQVTTDKLCVTRSDGSAVCITGDALDQILTKESVSPAASAPSVNTPPAPITPIASSSQDTAPSTATTTTDAPSIVPDYNATATLPSAPAAVATSSVLSPTAEQATSTQ